jgi:hypothetical protein
LAISFTWRTFAQDTIDPKVEQQIRALTLKYDDAFNKNDATAPARFAVLSSSAPSSC